MTALLASIPSPSQATLSLGPLTVHMYGLMLLAGIAACVWLTGVRWQRQGGDWDLIMRCAVWGVAFGVVGARLYHVVTSWSQVPDPKWQGVFEIWKGGLGVWGGIFLGVVAGAVIVRRDGSSVRRMMDAVAPGLLLAQGIGRIGNWWNQELFGKPTDLPWALRIDPEHRPPGYEQYATFHPTFLYELVWNLLGVGLLLLIDRRFRLRPPSIFALYVSWYTTFRCYEEVLRIDTGSHHIAGMRLNFWVSLGVFLVSTGFFVWWQFLRGEGEGRPPRLRRTPHVPKGPRMTVPKSRVRSGR
ncbi:MAG TPA: prolipoprotein diacylglyceryl transferase [Gaiellaceae bacterium]|nr:prolipoprotein diacylglyceryl transferase [Gaiellaceae bacterium]